MSTALSRYRAILVPLGLLALTLALYLPYALHAGWYYDDWALYAQFHEAGSSWGSQFHECVSIIPAGREVSCLFLVSEFHLFTDHRTAYAFASMAFLFAMGWLAYEILRRCRLGWGWSALIAALLILFPACDSVRFWAAASYGQYVVVLELVGVLLALQALKLQTGNFRYVLHAVSLLLMAFAMVTYEIVVPLVALNGIVYWAAFRDRKAIRRGLVDLGLAIAFLFYRLVLEPPGSEEGFIVHRTIGQNVTRGWHLIEAAWKAWHETFLPGALGTILLLLILVAAAVFSFRDAEVRRRLRPWVFLLAGGIVVAGAATLAFQTAADLYLPQVGSLFNRVVLPASLAYVCVFVALLGIVFELVRRFSPWLWAPIAVVAAIALVSAWHQLRIADDHRDHWRASWEEQQKALAGYDAALRGLPQHSRIIGFGVANWEPEYIPIFSAPWDLRGAIEYTTDISPPTATPMSGVMTCGPQGMLAQEVESFPYAASGEPLFFVDAVNRKAVRIDSQADCERAVEEFGTPPVFAGEPGIPGTLGSS